MRLPFGLCVSVPLRSWDPRRVEAVSRRPGIVALEVRLDLGRARSIPARWDGPLPVVATCRPVREGGAFEGPEEERLELLAAAAGHGARWIDLEADSRVPTSLARVSTILSRHEVEGPSRVVEGLARWTSVVRSRLVPPVAVKWVVRGDDAESLRTLREWIALNPADALGCDWILFGAGPSTGVASRVLSLSLGGRWAYVALDEGSRTAPGQPTLDRFLADFGPPSPEPPRALYGVTGRDVSSSASPAMHNAWLRARGAGLYLPVSQDRWDLSWAAEAGFAGLNVTIPFKEHAAAVGDADGEARAIGAANLLAAVSSGGPWRASNTDATGLTRVLGLWRARVGEGDAALVLGAGGASRAAVRALRLLGARVSVAARDTASAAWASASGARVLPWEDAARERPALVVNATPLGGSAGDPLPLPAEALASCRVLVEYVYANCPTRLQLAAWEAGVPTVIDGFALLEAQGADAFRIWTSREAGGEGAVALAAWRGLARGSAATRLVLVGARASGKSSIGREAARLLGWPFLDSDRLLEEHSGVPVGELLSRDADTFRRLEAFAIAEVLRRGGSFVLATGGGAVEDAGTRALLASEPGVAWLDVPGQILRERLRASPSGARPALLRGDPVSEVDAVLRQRNTLYASVSKIRLGPFDVPVRQTASEVVAWTAADAVSAGA